MKFADLMLKISHKIIQDETLNINFCVSFNTIFADVKVRNQK